MMADPLADIDRAIQQIKSKAEPKRTDMIELSSLLENFEKTSSSMKKGAHIKNKAQTAIVHFNLFPALHSCEELLPLYFFVGKYSETLGLHGVFDMLEKKEYFRNSLKFHVMWAETHAKKGHGQRFREILELAQKRLQEPQDMIESEFKSLAQKYLPNSNIFPDVTSKKKDRRRSHLDVLQKLADRFKTAKRVTSEKNVKIMLKHEFVDKIGYIPVSPEEYVWVQWLDDQGQQADEDDMDVSMQDATLQPSPKVVEPVHTPLMPKIPDYTVDEPKLEPVLEISEPEISMEKRRRIFSPEQPTRTSRFPNPPTHMAESPVSFREKEYQKAAAVFSDTVNLGPAPSKDITIPVISQPVETFEVYEDAESVAVPAVQPSCERRPLSQLNIVDRMDESPVLETKDTAKIPDPFGLDLSDVENDDGGSPYNFEDDPTLAGQRYGLTGDAKPTAGIVTSTPAPGLMGFGQNITPDDFFSVPIEENFGFIKKRQSLAPKTDFRASAQRSSVTPPQKETTISSAMAQMTVKSPVGVEEEENILERTGINKPRESISTQSINPWDSSVREKIMKRSKTPLVQHDFQYASPKISRNKDLTVGGMKFHVVDLVGEGGFAKVFKCVDEESQKTVALKYEVPSCSWEVYICDQLRSRLQQTVTPSARRSINCVMEITDAFIFKNSSILINEFLRYGTLLDLSNKLHGGAHSQLILLLSIQIATIIRDVQACQIIHGDVKPDNIMILRGIDENWDIEELLTTPLLKFIDWGRAIDMAAFEKTTSFKGRAGTANFDCPEMMTDKPWNYQTDFFGFVATMHVFIFGKYCKLLTVGRNTMDCSLKRRLACRDVMTNIFDRLLNIPSCQELPDWNEIIAEMISIFRQEFSAVEWRATARTFNQSLPDDK